MYFGHVGVCERYGVAPAVLASYFVLIAFNCWAVGGKELVGFDKFKYVIHVILN